MHDDDPQIHLAGKFPGAGTPAVKLIGPSSTTGEAGAAGILLGSASGGIAAATAGITTDTNGHERNVLRSNDFRSTRTYPLSYCKLSQYGSGICDRSGAL